ncbi:hypothetical protein CBL_10295 [Carabus blaptoides fortunei]
METKPDQKPVRRVLKKVKDFENVYDYFSYITTEFGDDTLHYEGYNWTADELFEMYLTGDTDAVWKLALPETPDYSQLPFIKSCYEPPDKVKAKGKYSGQDIVQFPCKPALKTVEEYFEAKRVHDKLIKHPRYNHWWPSRHLDPEFAKLKLIDAKESYLLTKQMYKESMVDIEKDKETLKHKSAKLREFTVMFNDLAYRNLFRKKESEQKIRSDLDLNMQKLREGKRMMTRIDKLMVVREDLQMRNEKMQMYEDYLNSVVECSNNKFENIQQILDRYDAVAFMKKRIVRNHLRDMFEMDAQKGKLLKLIADRKDAIRDFNNQMSDLARRYKYVVRRYQHWENAVQRLKKLCNKERAQTYSVEASIWNLYGQMCARKRMPMKEDRNDYKAQLAYILVTIKQYEKIVQIAQDKYAAYRATRAESSVSTVLVRPPPKEHEDIEAIHTEEPVLTMKENKGTQTLDVGLVDVGTMIWWEDEVRMANEGRVASKCQGLQDEQPGELTMLEEKMQAEEDMLAHGGEFQWMNLPKDESLEEQESVGQKDYTKSKDSTTAKGIGETRRSANKHSQEELKSSDKVDLPVSESSKTFKLPIKLARSPKGKGIKEHTKQEHVAEKSPKELSIGVQTELVEMQDKSQQCEELHVSVYVQTLDTTEVADEHAVLAEFTDGLALLKQATVLNRQLVSEQCQPRREGSTVSVHSTESARKWHDIRADWFYPAEWKATLLNMPAAEDETWRHPLDQRESTVGALLATGRHTSVAMKEQTTVRYPSKQIQAASIIFSDQRMCGFKLDGIKESAILGQHSRRSKDLLPIDRPEMQETLALTDVGLVQKLQAVLAERELQRSKGENVMADEHTDTKKSVWTELLDRITKKIKAAAEEKGEVYLKTKRPTEVRHRLEVWTKSIGGPKEAIDLHPTDEEDDNVQETVEEFVDVDAWTQTPREQTSDWVQTLPAREQYGWTQIERVDETTETDVAEVDLRQYAEASAQTDKPSEKFSSVDKTPDMETKVSSDKVTTNANMEQPTGQSNPQLKTINTRKKSSVKSTIGEKSSVIRKQSLVKTKSGAVRATNSTGVQEPKKTKDVKKIK